MIGNISTREIYGELHIEMDQSLADVKFVLNLDVLEFIINGVGLCVN